MDFPDFLSAQRPEGLSAGQRAQAIAMAREAQQDAREKRLEEAEAARAAEYRDRVMMTASALGLDAGSVTRAAMAVGDARAKRDDLAARLAKAEDGLASAQRYALDITRVMDQAMETAGGPAVRGAGLGDLTVERQLGIQAALAEAQRSGDGSPLGWMG